MVRDKYGEEVGIRWRVFDVRVRDLEFILVFVCKMDKV